jgi:hypothetical protein
VEPELSFITPVGLTRNCLLQSHIVIALAGVTGAGRSVMKGKDIGVASTDAYSFSRDTSVSLMGRRYARLLRMNYRT